MIRYYFFFKLYWFKMKSNIERGNTELLVAIARGIANFVTACCSKKAINDLSRVYLRRNNNIDRCNWYVRRTRGTKLGQRDASTRPMTVLVYQKPASDWSIDLFLYVTWLPIRLTRAIPQPLFTTIRVGSVEHVAAEKGGSHKRVRGDFPNYYVPSKHQLTETLHQLL